jgi:hypothetical protein
MRLYSCTHATRNQIQYETSEGASMDTETPRPQKPAGETAGDDLLSGKSPMA